MCVCVCFFLGGGLQILQYVVKDQELTLHLEISTFGNLLCFFNGMRQLFLMRSMARTPRSEWEKHLRAADKKGPNLWKIFWTNHQLHQLHTKKNITCICNRCICFLILRVIYIHIYTYHTYHHFRLIIRPNFDKQILFKCGLAVKSLSRCSSIQ